MNDLIAEIFVLAFVCVRVCVFSCVSVLALPFSQIEQQQKQQLNECREKRQRQ